MSEGALPWSEPLIHLQMLITVSGGELQQRVPQVVFFNKYSSGTYHMLNAALNSFTNIDIFKPHNHPLG